MITNLKSQTEERPVILKLSSCDAGSSRAQALSAIRALCPGENLEIWMDSEPEDLTDSLSNVEPSVFDWYVEKVSATQWKLHLKKLPPQSGCCGVCGG